MDRVFRAFVTKEAVAKWLPPTGARAIVEEFDPKPGGAIRVTLIFDDGGDTKRKTDVNTDTVEGQFVSIVVPTRIEQCFTFVSDDPQFAGAMEMIWRLAKVPGGTRVSVAARNVPKGIKVEDHQKGMRSSLKNLAAYVEAR